MSSRAPSPCGEQLTICIFEILHLCNHVTVVKWDHMSVSCCVMLQVLCKDQTSRVRLQVLWTALWLLERGFGDRINQF